MVENSRLQQKAARQKFSFIGFSLLNDTVRPRPILTLFPCGLPSPTLVALQEVASLPCHLAF